MKSYTDIEQSKKLTEFLPLESADMGWNVFVDETTRILPIDDWNLVKNGSGNVKFYPAWSLAALLGVLPAECECMVLEHINYGNNRKEYFMHYVGGENTEDHDNPIDACYEMIIKLKERNLI